MICFGILCVIISCASASVAILRNVSNSFLSVNQKTTPLTFGMIVDIKKPCFGENHFVGVKHFFGMLLLSICHGQHIYTSASETGRLGFRFSFFVKHAILLQHEIIIYVGKIMLKNKQTRDFSISRTGKDIEKSGFFHCK